MNVPTLNEIRRLKTDAELKKYEQILKGVKFTKTQRQAVKQALNEARQNMKGNTL